MKANRLISLAALMLLAASSMAALTVSAARYDGTYNVSYCYYNGSQWVWIDLPEGALIVSGGETSSPRSGYFIGHVSDDGTVWMQSPNPLAPSETATWTGTIYSDGSGDGDWKAPDGYGSWTAERISGPMGSLGSLALLGVFSGLGGGAILTSLGYGQSKQPFVRGRPGLGAKTPRWCGKVRSRSFWSEPPNPPPPVINQDNQTGVRTSGRPPFIGEPAPNQSPPPGLPPFIGQPGSGTPTPGNLPPFIGMDGGGVAATGPGARVGGDLFPRLETLFGARVPTGMRFWWEPPKFNPETEQLVGYRVYGYIWGPNSTQSVQVLGANWGPGALGGNANFVQTYRFSTGGDFAGVRVEPLFRRLTGPNPGEIFPGQASTFLPW